MSRLAGGGSRRLALQPGLEVWPVFLQFLVVSGNCKELWRERGIALSAPFFPLLGWEVPSWDQEKSGWRFNPKATGRYLVLVIGAEAVPGLRVVLSVPAVEMEVVVVGRTVKNGAWYIINPQKYWLLLNGLKPNLNPVPTQLHKEDNGCLGNA